MIVRIVNGYAVPDRFLKVAFTESPLLVYIRPRFRGHAVYLQPPLCVGHLSS